jgi:hypothetical protein
MARFQVAQYVQFAETALLELVRAEGAVLVREAEAKISDDRWPSIPTAVNPHHLTTARGNLLRKGLITLSAVFDASGTRLMHPVDDRGRKEVIRTASKRKRALHGYLETWARPTSRYPSGIIGEAGERVVRASLRAAAEHGVRPVQAGATEITRLFDNPVPGGALDGAVWVERLDEYGRATGSTLCPIEVKNIRHWIYPQSHELFQLLHKSALLQQQYVDIDICPVLVTRARSWTADQMSRDLGFRIFDVHKQFVLPIADVPEDRVDAVKTELGYKDLTRTDDADEVLTRLCRGSLITTSTSNATLWRSHGSKFSDHYEQLRDPGVTDTKRDGLMKELREAAAAEDSYATAAW